jgi:hypothetical protein
VDTITFRLEPALPASRTGRILKVTKDKQQL